MSEQFNDRTLDKMSKFQYLFGLIVSKLPFVKTEYTYILSNKNRTVLYVGVTSRIRLRMLQHKSGHGCVFSSRYNVYDLMYFETIPLIVNAIKREKQLKNWHKEWKWNLIRESNPNLIDLATKWFTDEEILECKKKMDREKGKK